MRNQYRPEQPERMTALMLLLLASFMCFPSVIAAVHRDHYYSLTPDYDKYIPSLQYHLSRLPLRLPLHSHYHPHHVDHRSEIPGQVLPYPLQVTASVNLRSIFEVRN